MCSATSLARPTRCVAIDRLQPQLVYCGAFDEGLWRSEDTPRPHTHHVRWIEPDPHHQGRLFVAVEAGTLVGSLDGGANWRDRTPDGPRDTHHLAAHLSAPDRFYSAAGYGYYLSEPAVFYAARESDVYRSIDGGASWNRIYVDWPEGCLVERPHAMVVVEGKPLTLDPQLLPRSGNFR